MKIRVESGKLWNPDVVGMGVLIGGGGKMDKVANERFGFVLGLFFWVGGGEVLRKLFWDRALG